MEGEEDVPPCPRCNGPFVLDHCVWCGCRACIGRMSCGACTCQAYDMCCGDCDRLGRRDGGDGETEGGEDEESEEESDGGDSDVTPDLGSP